MTLLVAVLVLGILIVVHEFGHFITAKAFKVGVLEFAIGFGRKLIRKRVGETVYSVGLIPLGGYVRMVGDDPSAYASDNGQGEVEAGKDASPEPVPEEQALYADKSRWFLEKGIFARSCIVLAGPLFNVVFAILLAVLGFYVYGIGVAVDEPVIGTVVPGHPAEKAGLKEDDRIVSVDGRAPLTWEEFARTVSTSGGREMLFVVERKAQSADRPERIEVRISGEPESAELKLLGPEKSESSYKIGVLQNLRREPATFGQALLGGLSKTWFITEITIRGLWGMISGVISPKNIAGPIFIFKEAARSAERGMDYLVDFVVFLSMSLAILNLLPIPVLDGGHLFFFLLEALRGKPLSLKIQGVATQVGLAALLLLMAFALGNDIMRLFS